MNGSAQPFNPFAPGFDFLQKLASGSPAQTHALGQWKDWVAPTMNVEDLEKRIGELKTVLFWLEQNQRALAATIQAMEVQKMTLSALQTMNVPVENWASTMVQSWQQFAQGTAPDAAPPAPREERLFREPVAPVSAPVQEVQAAPPVLDTPVEEAASATDPMQWWGALTQQFQQIASQAVQDVTQQAMQHANTTQQVAESAANAMRATASGGTSASKTAARKPVKKAPAKRPAAKTTASKTAAVKKTTAARKR